tara:strand:- start:1086 stop:1283 length:198 start_codon:yes stop_codon:yes gene_type:complete
MFEATALEDRPGYLRITFGDSSPEIIRWEVASLFIPMIHRASITADRLKAEARALEIQTFGGKKQ